MSHIHKDADGVTDRGFALLAVLFVMIIFFVVVGVLFFQSTTERAVVVNQRDYATALNYAEAGLEWAFRRVDDASNLTALLQGPDTSTTADDNLIGLRDLSLTATTQIIGSNQATKSAIVTRDFGDGSKTYEALRVRDGTDAAALIYLRIDDNYDDDPTDPTNNDPLVDQDNKVRVTVVAEYPVFLSGSGGEQANMDQRGRAARMLQAEFMSSAGRQPAVGSNGDIDLTGSLTVCGDCGDLHANGDLYVNSGNDVCGDGTASGSFSGSTSAIAGTSGGGFPTQDFPIVSPFDDLYVPTIDTFDTSGDTGLPDGLRCPRASTLDPGANKYFALVADGDKGLVYKAYWDFTNDRWTWREIENMDGANVKLDDCGRVEGDARYEFGDAGEVDDGTSDTFFGWKGEKLEWTGCTSCGGVGGDDSMCTVGNNDFIRNGYYPYGGGAFQASPRLPGNFAPDTFEDFPSEFTVKSGGSKWDYGSDPIYSPLYGAVVWVLGTVNISGNPANSGSTDFRCSSGAGCSSSSMPYGLWKLSIIAVGDILMQGQANLGPANTDADYWFQLITGRDLSISGNPQEYSAACSGTSCSYGAPANIQHMSGIYAAHEQIQISGSPNIFGFLVAEDAIDCSSTVTAPTEVNGGGPNVFYDCDHPPSPWVTNVPTQRLNWQEVR